MQKLCSYLRILAEMDVPCRKTAKSAAQRGVAPTGHGTWYGNDGTRRYGSRTDLLGSTETEAERLYL